MSAPVPPWFYSQSGVLAVRGDGAGVEVLLVTNRKGTRWVIPKGVVEPGLSPAASARKEAWEEAGVRGVLAAAPLGRYRYDKWQGTCTVEVFRMTVTEEAADWPEGNARQRRWWSPPAAAGQVREPELRVLLRNLDGPPKGEEG